MKLGKTEEVMLDLALATKIGQLHEMRFSCFELSEAQKMEAQSAIKLLVILRKAAGTDEEFIRTLETCFEGVPHFQELTKIVQNFQSENPRLERQSSQRPTLPNGVYQFTPSKEQKQYFRKMLLNVSTSLNWIHLEIMVALSPIPDNLKEYIQKGFQLFEELQRHGCISENDTELLDDFFSRFNLTRPLELLQAYQDRFQQVIYDDPPPSAPVYAQLPLRPSSSQDPTHPPSSLQSTLSSMSSMSSLGSGRFATLAEDRQNISHEHEFVSGISIPFAPPIPPPYEAQSSEAAQRFVPTSTSSTSETQNPSSHSPLHYPAIPASSPGSKPPHTTSTPPSSLQENYHMYPRPHDASHPSSFKPPSDHFPRPPECGPVYVSTTQSPVLTSSAAKLAASIKSQPSDIYPISQRLRKRPHEAREEEQIPPLKRTIGSHSLQGTPQQPVSVPSSTPGRSVYPQPPPPSTSASQYVSMRQREQQLPSMYWSPQSNQQSLASSQSSMSSTSSGRFATRPEQRQATGDQYEIVPGNSLNMPPAQPPSYPVQAASLYSSMSSGGSSLSSGGSYTFPSGRFVTRPEQRQATGDQYEFVPGNMPPAQPPSYPIQTASRYSSMSSGGSSLSFQEPSFTTPVQRQGSDLPSLPSMNRYVVAGPGSGGYLQSYDHKAASRAQNQQQKTEVIISPSILSELHGNQPFPYPSGVSSQLHSTTSSNSTSMSHGHESLWLHGAQQSERHYASSQPSLRDEQQIHPSIEESGEEASAGGIVYDQCAAPQRNYPSPKTAYTGPQNQPSEAHQTREQAFATNYSASSSSEARVSLSGNPVHHPEQGDTNVAIPSRENRLNKKAVAATVQPSPPQASATNKEGDSSTSEEESGPPEPKRRRGSSSSETSTESEEDTKPEENAKQGWTALFGKIWNKVTGVNKDVDKKTKSDDDESDHYTSCEEDSDN